MMMMIVHGRVSNSTKSLFLDKRRDLEDVNIVAFTPLDYSVSNEKSRNSKYKINSSCIML